ncbi:MAG: Na/Pi cotransporter family protein [Spirochaetaceae bacterium]|nr:MAG: Na/Pi cotransporter family protein [Spirochaetaceae bacterium]
MVAVGSIGVFMAGFSQVAGASMRIIGPWFRSRAAQTDTTKRRRLLLGTAAGAGGSAVSAVVSLLSMVDSGTVRAERTVWILLGVNIGATAACWLVALAGYRMTLAPMALILMACSLPFRLSATLGRYTRPDVLTGLALLMLGIDLVSARLAVVPDAPALLEAMQRLFSSGAAPVAGFVLGFLVSTLIRSSVGTVVLAMSLLTRGWLPFNVAVAMTLGSNGGLALTGLLAGEGLDTEARRTVVIHLLINVLACIWAAAAFTVLVDVTAALIRGSDASATAARLALFHSAIHIINPLLLLPLQHVVMRLAQQLVPARDRRADAEDDFSLVLLPPSYPDALDANLIRLQSGLARMAELAYEMLMIVINTSQFGDYAEQETRRVISLRSSVKKLEDEIASALTGSVQLPCSRRQAERIQQQHRTAQQLSLISDDCYKTMRLFARSYRKNYRFHQESRDELFDFTSLILDFLKYNSDYLEGKIEPPNWELANRMEDAIDKVRDTLKIRVGKVLQNDNEVDIQAELAFIDIVSHLEHVGDRCLSISDSVRKLNFQRRGRANSGEY